MHSTKPSPSMIKSEPGSPSISLGVPVYNGDKFLAQTLESILDQTHDDFELIISDNVSTDGTEEIGRRYARLDSRVRYVRSERHVGAAANFNRTFHLSVAPYFRWCGSDDLLLPESLERSIAVLEQKPDYVLCTSGVDFIDGDGTVFEHYDEKQGLEAESAVARFLQEFNQDGHCNALYGLCRREVMARTGLMGDFPGSDVVFLGEMAMNGKFFELSETLFLRRTHPEAFSYPARTADEAKKKHREFYDPAGTNSLIHARYWRHLAEYFRAVRRARCGPAEKLGLSVRVARLAWWWRGSLAKELREVLR